MICHTNQDKTAVVIWGDTKETLTCIGHYLAIRFDFKHVDLVENQKNVLENCLDSSKIVIYTVLSDQFKSIKDRLFVENIFSYFLTDFNLIDTKQSYSNMKKIFLKGSTIEKKIDCVIQALELDGFNKFDYELWFRKDYEKTLREQTLKTIVRPGIRTLPNPKGTFVRQNACVRILKRTGSKDYLPQFKSFLAMVEIESIKVRRICELNTQDLKQAPEEINTQDKIQKHLKGIYNRKFGLEEWVSMIGFSYKNK